ncbi:unnamed protein product [Zymoseptoria tritici ST99CH_3D7]|uniref:Carrier domain-containing protein n=1 Tax=Zymoseptoria tritici (strain ST99CH_3D7) TaxID=1276538 RepID=A0A1X7RPQ1_ZYMT9|nr:unnamed protein product [Zymoseptoria tritici ST99CH_3D7]
MASSTRLVFFGGQGSKSLFSANEASRRDKAVKSSQAVKLLLSSCHSSLQREFLDLKSTRNAPAWAISIEDYFKSPDGLLLVANRFQKHPIVQGVALCLQQLVDLILIKEAQPEGLPWTVAAGFCSGSISALAVACSGNQLEFNAQGTEAVRLAFWIGVRAGELAVELGGDDSQIQPWSLAVNGVAKEEIDALLTAFNAVSRTGPGSASQLNISTISAADSVAISGEPGLLAAFQAIYLPTEAVCHKVQVYAMYHGGEQALGSMHKVLGDVARRQILLGPSTSPLQIPLLCSRDGLMLVPGSELVSGVVERLVRDILIESVDWMTTWNVMTKPDQGKVILTGVGPGSYQFLMSSYRSLDDEQRNLTEVATPVGKHSLSRESDGFAIIGMSLQFPLGSDKQQLWDSLERGLSAIQEIPSSRFAIIPRTIIQGDTLDRSAFPPATANLLNDSPFLFDHEFFNISPREATSMDPQQKLILHGAKQALDDAGWVADSTISSKRATLGCYIGAATDDYVQNLSTHSDIYYSTGTLRAFLSGKVSYAFGLSGPSITVDTACSSSIVAITQACRALMNEDCSMALAGGVNAITSPNMHSGLSRAGFLSPTGQCKTFDRDADGYARAEGCGLFVLKRLRDAMDDNDRIHGVIKAAEINQCGNSRSITQPDSATQIRLFERVLAKARVDPKAISVVETHGTGTQAGDAAEMSSILAVFGKRDLHRPLSLGSIKANIGHAEAASGAASLGKLLLMFQHNRIPPQISLRNINPRFPDLAEHNVCIPIVAKGWMPRLDEPRIALLNNFGAAGSNAALIIQEPPSQALPIDHRTAPSRKAYNFNLTAKRQADVKEYCSAYLRLLKGRPDIVLKDLCYTVSARRPIFDYRLSFVCKSVPDLIQQLETCNIPASLPPRAPRPVVFVFSGQGSFYPGMSKALLATNLVFRRTLVQCDIILASQKYHIGVVAMIEDEFIPRTAEENVVHTQILCFCVGYGLASMWISWNLTPSVVLGHSLGEYVALAISGALSLADALKLVTYRAQLMLTYCSIGDSGMLACNIPDHQLEKVLRSSPATFSRLNIACRNSVHHSVAAGPVAEIDNLLELLQSQGARCHKLNVPLGFHSSALEPIRERLTQFCANDISISSPVIPTGSCYHGRLLRPGDLTAEYFGSQTCGTVEFTNLVRSLLRDTSVSGETYIEIGSSPSTLPLIKSTLPSHRPTVLYLATLRHRVDPWISICESLQALSRVMPGSIINWREIWNGSDASLMDGLSYPFQKTERYMPYNERTDMSFSPMRSNTGQLSSFYNLRPTNRSNVNTSHRSYETALNGIECYVKGHVVGGQALCPASVYHGMLLEACALPSRTGAGSNLIVESMAFARPLVLRSPTSTLDSTLILLEVDQKTEREANGQSALPAKLEFAFSSSSEGSEAPLTEHCSGFISRETAAEANDCLAAKSAAVHQSMFCIRSNQSEHNVLRTHMIYRELFSRVVTYSERFHTVQELIVPESKLEGTGTFRLHRDERMRNGVPSPVFVDTLLHVAGFIANLRVGPTEACICVAVGTVRILPSPLLTEGDLHFYCRLAENSSSSSFLADSYAMRSDGTMVAAVENMRFTKLNLGSFQAHLAKATGTVAPKAVTSSLKPEVWTNSSVQTLVKEILSEVVELPLHLLTEDTGLAEIGVDSMMQLEFRAALCKRFELYGNDMDLPMNGATICDVQQQVLRLLSKTCTNDTRRPDMACSETKSHNNQTNRSLVEIISELTGISEDKLEPGNTLEALGVDSLLLVEFQKILTAQFGHVATKLDLLDSELTIERLGVLLGGQGTSAEGRGISMTCSTPPAKSECRDSNDHNIIVSDDRADYGIKIDILQQGSVDLPPLLLFHDGSGTVEAYRRLRSIGCTLLGVSSPSCLENDHNVASSLAQLAQWYAASIAAFPARKIVLGGWSFGGVVAYEVAQRLSGTDTTVLGVIFIDSPCPIHHDALPTQVIEFVASNGVEGQAASNDGGRGPGVRSFLASQFHHHARLLLTYEPEKVAATGADVSYVMIQCRDNFDTMRLCGIEYPWLANADARRESTSQWSELLGRKMIIAEIPGNHFEPFTKTNARSTSEEVGKAYRGIVSNGVQL